MDNAEAVGERMMDIGLGAACHARERGIVFQRLTRGSSLWCMRARPVIFGSGSARGALIRCMPRNTANASGYRPAPREHAKRYSMPQAAQPPRCPATCATDGANVARRSCAPLRGRRVGNGTTAAQFGQPCAVRIAQRLWLTSDWASGPFTSWRTANGAAERSAHHLSATAQGTASNFQICG
eukprot:9476328-Pyramimonas_sp.AAC.1